MGMEKGGWGPRRERERVVAAQRAEKESQAKVERAMKGGGDMAVPGRGGKSGEPEIQAGREVRARRRWERAAVLATKYLVPVRRIA
jgi:hypothetical protein